jgi:hypothetical protein
MCFQSPETPSPGQWSVGCLISAKNRWVFFLEMATRVDERHTYDAIVPPGRRQQEVVKTKSYAKASDNDNAVYNPRSVAIWAGSAGPYMPDDILRV